MKKTSEQLFQSRLKENETIHWYGQPAGGLLIREKDLLLIPGSIILVGFAGLMNVIAFYFYNSLLLQVFAVGVSALAVYLGLFRFLADIRRRRRIHYCVTNFRVMMCSGRRQTLRTLPLKNIERMDLAEEKNGRGHISLGNTNPLWAWLFGQFMLSSEHLPGFENIDHAREVFQLIEQLKRKNVSGELINTVKQIEFNEN